MAVLLPFGMFLAVVSSLAFYLHYSNPQLTWLITIGALFIVLIFGYSVYQLRDERYVDRCWYQFMFGSSLLLWASAVLGGCLIFNSQSSPYYEITRLGIFEGVNPSKAHGQSFLDSSLITFQEGTHLDFTLTTKFSNDVTYCVTPIVVGNQTELGAYDFWAVGENCCPDQGLGSYSFQCGDWADPHAHGAIRVTDKNKEGYYRLAVQMAASRFKIQTIHPLFFTWQKDPITTMNRLRGDGIKRFILFVGLVFGLQLVSVVIVTINLAKSIGKTGYIPPFNI